MRRRELAVSVELLLGLVLLLLPLLGWLLIIHSSLSLVSIQPTIPPINFSSRRKIGSSRAPKAHQAAKEQDGSPTYNQP